MDAEGISPEGKLHAQDCMCMITKLMFDLKRMCTCHCFVVPSQLGGADQVAEGCGIK